ncbi:MAG: hypothetical protein A2061_02395 [Gallionellales bacterium GWA2_59_43]|nr:MAG: hypothetical protein A2061_02395 [Gallionellales bacterium GWA2_59_43]
MAVFAADLIAFVSPRHLRQHFIKSWGVTNILAFVFQRLGYLLREVAPSSIKEVRNTTCFPTKLNGDTFVMSQMRIPHLIFHGNVSGESNVMSCSCPQKK